MWVNTSPPLLVKVHWNHSSRGEAPASQKMHRDGWTGGNPLGTGMQEVRATEGMSDIEAKLRQWARRRWCTWEEPG